jgi:hypothetical protein
MLERTTKFIMQNLPSLILLILETCAILRQLRSFLFDGPNDPYSLKYSETRILYAKSDLLVEYFHGFDTKVDNNESGAINE